MNVHVQTRVSQLLALATADSEAMKDTAEYKAAVAASYNYLRYYGKVSATQGIALTEAVDKAEKRLRKTCEYEAAVSALREVVAALEDQMGVTL